MSEVLKSVEQVSDELLACVREYDEAQKDANAHEEKARHLRNVTMAGLKEKKANLQTALIHRQTVGKVNDAVAAADEHLAKAAEARRNQEAAAAEAEQLRDQLKKDLAELKKAKEEAAVTE